MRFLTAIAARTGQMVNYADLSRDVSVDNKTISLANGAMSGSILETDISGESGY